MKEGWEEGWDDGREWKGMHGKDVAVRCSA